MKNFIMILLLIASCSVFALPTAKYTLLVVDENGIPIEGAEARLSFMKPKSEGWGGQPYGVTGTTDEKGVFTGIGSTQAYLVYSARAEGYYSSGHKFRDFKGVSGILGFRKWQPWNPTLKVVLKKIKKPIAMYAYYTEWVEIPKNGVFVGYDLKKHDWVSPYGKGIIADFLFRLDKDVRSKQDYDAYLTLNFSDPLDGIQSVLVGKEQGSAYKLDYEAPKAGYIPELKQHKYLRPNESLPLVFKENTNYYFRIRSNGDVENALYGKIHGNIEFSRFGYSNGAVRFTYYLNPTEGEQNIEFNPKNNLFKGLKRSLHNVSKP